MKKLLIIILVFGLNVALTMAQEDSGLVVMSSPSSLFEQANDAFINDDFENSESLYIQILEKEVESAEVYFNLGNVYFKMGNILII